MAVGDTAADRTRSRQRDGIKSICETDLGGQMQELDGVVMRCVRLYLWAVAGRSVTASASVMGSWWRRRGAGWACSRQGGEGRSDNHDLTWFTGRHETSDRSSTHMRVGWRVGGAVVGCMVGKAVGSGVGLAVGAPVGACQGMCPERGGSASNVKLDCKLGSSCA